MRVMAKNKLPHWLALVGWFLFVLVLAAAVAAALDESRFVAALRLPRTWIIATIMAIIASVGTWFGTRNE